MSHWTFVVSVLCCAGVGISALSGKGYYCRDPDTGKLHPGNSTWPSTTFCGNYTCKLRKKVTLVTKAPLREFNVINTVSRTEKSKSAEVNEVYEEDTRKDHLSILTTLNPTYFSVPPTNTPTTISDVSEKSSQKEDNIENQKLLISTEEGDRFLTENEIKTISKILHSVKKSDLEAIVDIYNLAQDIYKEMDKITSNNIVEETLKTANTLPKASGEKTYWYEPLNRQKPRIDLEFQGSNPYPTTVERSTIEPNTYFQGVLSKTDFGALPYYYPMSNFQRHSSYVHPHNAQAYAPESDKPCSTNTPAPIPYQPPTPSYYPYNYLPQTYGGVMKKPFTVDTQKVLQPSVLLPYPFSYVQHYNVSAYPVSLNYDPWSHFDVIKNTDKYQQNLKANLPQPKVSSNALKTKADLKSNQKSRNDDDNTKTSGEKSLLDTLFEHAKMYEPKSKSKPAWQTDPLSPNVIEEIKAHFESKAKLLKPLSIRKKVKIEKVGKVLKMDDRNRDKRDVDFEDDSTERTDEGFETYLEKTTCRSEEDPGFYKMGNQSALYPSCCPQRINNVR